MPKVMDTVAFGPIAVPKVANPMACVVSIRQMHWHNPCMIMGQSQVDMIDRVGDRWAS